MLDRLAIVREMFFSLRINWRIQEGFEKRVWLALDFIRIPLVFSKDELMRIDGIIGFLPIPSSVKITTW